MRTTRKGLEFSLKLLNRKLGMKEQERERTADGKLKANIGTLGMEVSSPGDGVTRYQLSQMNEHGGINVIGNRTLLGASAFEDYLRGVSEGIELQRQSQRETINYALQYIGKGIADGAFDGCVIDPKFVMERLEKLADY